MTQTDSRPDELSDALPAGSPIGGYAVRRLLGQGGFGITYEADNRVTGRSVAIKEFFPASLVRRSGTSKLVFSKVNEETIEWALRKFEETTTTLCKLSHPNIVQVIDYVPANDTGYMIMELLHGQTLKDWLKSRATAPTLDELKPMLAPVMDALSYVHGQGLVHRDVAPDNILITGDGRPVLIDFGSVSADLSRAGRDKVSSTVGLTKRHYTAPEQMSSRTRPGAAADIYSLGAVVYRALCGTEPMDGQDRIDAMFLRQEPDPYASMAAMRPAVCTPHAAALVDKSLDMRPENRPSAVADLRAGLWLPPPPAGTDAAGAGAGLAGAGGSATGSTPSSGSAAPPTPRESPIKWIVAALAIVAVAGVAGMLGYKWLDDNNRRELARLDTRPPAAVEPSPAAPEPSPSPPPAQPQPAPPSPPQSPPEEAPPSPPTAEQPIEPPQPAQTPQAAPPTTEQPTEPPQQAAPPPPAPPAETPVVEPTPQETSEPSATSCTVAGLDPNGINWLALRTRPSFQATWSSTRMGPGTQVSSFGRSGDWRHVRLASGETGWANGRFLSCGSGSPGYAPPPRATSTAATCRVGGLDPKGINWLALRRQPSFTSTWSSTRMGPGTSLQVTGRSGEWLHVKLASGETGWANGKFVLCGGD